RVGCLGRITSFSETDDGCLLVTLTGLTRFSISVELEMQRGYRRIRADFSRFTSDLHGDTEGVERETLLDALRTYFSVRGFEANWDAIDEMPDSMLVSTLAMVCPFEAAEKQALLEAPNTQERSKALLALLRMGAHDSDTGESGRALS
ncbi:MAG: peptidase S16, partial [Alphaproteobacteria bacterium]